jgi:prevent-host-death family protein
MPVVRAVTHMRAGPPSGAQLIDEARMIQILNVHAAKTNFSKLLARVALGEEIVIAKDGKPMARLIPYVSAGPERTLGAYAGKVWMSDDALETPSWLVDAFEGIGGDVRPPAPKRHKK